jgi:hypothetical protein
VNRYLAGVYTEAQRRGYAFDRRKLGRAASAPPIRESAGQLALEWVHLLAKLRVRQPQRYRELLELRRPAAHPLFRIVPGPVPSWERLLSATPKVTPW